MRRHLPPPSQTQRTEGQDGSPGEIRTRVGGFKALFPSQLDDRAPTTIHTPTPQERIKSHTPTQNHPQRKNIEGGHTPEPETTAPQRKQPKNRSTPIRFQKKPRQFREKPRPNHTPTQRKGGRGRSYIGTRKTLHHTKGTLKSLLSHPIQHKNVLLSNEFLRNNIGGVMHRSLKNPPPHERNRKTPPIRPRSYPKGH
jgi:hypothetical protein